MCIRDRVATLPSINIALWFALPLTLVSGGDAAECLTIALAFAAIQNILNTVGNLVKVGFLHRQDALIEKGKIKQAWWYPACGHIWTFVSCMIIVPVFCLAGSAVISNIVNALPPQINAITSTFTGLLPAIGFMILMVTLIHTPVSYTHLDVYKRQSLGYLGVCYTEPIAWILMAVFLLAAFYRDPRFRPGSHDESLDSSM